MSAEPGGTFRSLKLYRNYRLFFIGQLVSMAGTWMQATAQSWLVFRVLGAGAGALGVMVGLSFLPALLLGPWFGVLVDRCDKRRLVFVSQSVLCASASVLAVLTLTGHVQLWMVYVLAMVNGTFTALDNPTRQTLLVEMVGRDDLPNATGLTSVMFNLARIVGPGLAGALLQIGVSPGWCFVINAASFAAVLVAIKMMRTNELTVTPRVQRAPGQVREGLAYAWATPKLRRLLLSVVVVSGLGMNQAVILPALATNTFHGQAGLFGLFGVANGAGAVLAGVLTARRRLPPISFTAKSIAAAGVTMFFAASAPTWWLEMIALFLFGLAMMSYFGTVSPRLALGSDPDKRGRILALHSMAMFGSSVVGAPLIGWIVRHHGPRMGLVTGGVALGAVSLGLMFEPLVERFGRSRTASVFEPSCASLAETT